MMNIGDAPRQSDDGKDKDSLAVSSPTQKNNALMSRLQVFLPQIKEANQALTAENASRVDLQLESDKEEDDDDDDSETDDEEENKEDTHYDTPELERDESSLIEHPTIQIQFAVGNLDDNPMMKILAESDSDESDDGNTSDPSMKEDEEKFRKRAVEDLLSHDSKQATSYESPKKKTKPLITELS